MSILNRNKGGPQVEALPVGSLAPDLTKVGIAPEEAAAEAEQSDKAPRHIPGFLKSKPAFLLYGIVGAGFFTQIMGCSQLDSNIKAADRADTQYFAGIMQGTANRTTGCLGKVAVLNGNVDATKAVASVNSTTFLGFSKTNHTTVKGHAFGNGLLINQDDKNLLGVQISRPETTTVNGKVQASPAAVADSIVWFPKQVGKTTKNIIEYAMLASPTAPEQVLCTIKQDGTIAMGSVAPAAETVAVGVLHPLGEDTTYDDLLHANGYATHTGQHTSP